MRVPLWFWNFKLWFGFKFLDYLPCRFCDYCVKFVDDEENVLGYIHYLRDFRGVIHKKVVFLKI